MSNQIYIDALMAFDDYISHHIEEDNLIDKAIKQTLISKYHFYRLFKTVTGMSINAYVTEKRLINVMQDLIEGKKILNAAIDNGFNSNEVMTRQFKGNFQITPSVFKRLKQSEQYERLENASKAMSLDFRYLEIQVKNQEGTINNKVTKETLEPMYLIGKSRLSDDSMVESIPEFVGQVAVLVGERDDLLEDALYRICTDVNNEKEIPTFKEFVGIPIKRSGSVSDGLEVFEIKTCDVLTFVHKGPLYTPEHTPIVNTYELIYKYRLPAINISVTDQYFIERYGQDFYGIHHPDSVIKIMMSI